MKTEHLKIMLIYQTIIPSSDWRKVLKICMRVEKIKAGLMPEIRKKNSIRNAPFRSTVFRILPLRPSFFEPEMDGKKLQYNKKEKSVPFVWLDLERTDE